MHLTPYVENLQRELATAAEAGGDEARALAERLTIPLESATRLVLLGALSEAMAEVTRDLAPGSVDVRLRGLDPEFVVTPPAAEADENTSNATGAPIVVPPGDDDGATARVNLRLPAQLKTAIEEAASHDSLSVNAWLVRAATLALDSTKRSSNPLYGYHLGQQGFTGWVR